jgi:hypothetical protein
MARPSSLPCQRASRRSTAGAQARPAPAPGQQQQQALEQGRGGFQEQADSHAPPAVPLRRSSSGSTQSQARAPSPPAVQRPALATRHQQLQRLLVYAAPHGPCPGGAHAGAPPRAATASPAACMLQLGCPPSPESDALMAAAASLCMSPPHVALPGVLGAGVGPGVEGVGGDPHEGGCPLAESTCGGQGHGGGAMLSLSCDGSPGGPRGAPSSGAPSPVGSRRQLTGGHNNGGGGGGCGPWGVGSPGTVDTAEVGVLCQGGRLLAVLWAWLCSGLGCALGSAAPWAWLAPFGLAVLGLTALGLAVHMRAALAYGVTAPLLQPPSPPSSPARSPLHLPPPPARTHAAATSPHPSTPS